MKTNRGWKGFGKKLIVFVLSFALVGSSLGYFGAVEVSAVNADLYFALDEKNYPDENFRNYLIKNYDKDKNGALTAREVSGVKKMDVSNMGFTSLGRIEAFEDLEILYCQNNKLTGLSTAYNKNLNELNCSNNQIESLTIPESLSKIDCSNNKIKTLTLKDGNLGMTSKNQANFDNNPWIVLNVEFDSRYGALILPSEDKTQTYTTDEPYLVLQDWTMYENRVKNLKGGKFIERGYQRCLVPTSYPGTVSYDYDCDEGRGFQEIHCTIKFTAKYIPLKKTNISISSTEYKYDSYTKTPGVTVTYKGKQLQKDADYTVTYKNNIMPGKASVIIKGLGQYTGTVTKYFNIEGLPIKDIGATLAYTTTTYSGSAKKPAVTVGWLTKGEHYTVSYKNNVKAGTATVTIKGKGIYSGTIKKTFKITRKAISKATLGTTSYFYNGETKKPAVTVKAGNKVLLKAKKADNANVDLTYGKGRTKPGTYKVTVKGIGNYKGTITKKFTIKVKGTSLKKVTAGKKQITVNWAKQEKKFITGYEIRYSKNKNMSKATTVSVKKAGTTKKVIKKLSAKQKYYVQVRTYKKINGKNYYSAWSAKKTVTTKK